MASEDYERSMLQRARIIAIVVLLLIASPGPLILFASRPDITPWLLVLSTPIVIVFIIGFRKVIMSRDS